MQVSSTSAVQVSNTDGSESIREAFRRKNIPAQTINILIASLAESTITQYSGAIKQWLSFCIKNGINAYEASENQALEWLTERFHDGASYGSLNNCRAVLGLLIGEKVSQGTTVSRFFRGVFRMRPTKPRYKETWDVSPVLQTIVELYPLNLLSLPQLTSRLTILLALATAHRMQTLALIKLENITENENGFSIRIDSLIKTSRPGVRQPLLLLPRFSEKPKLCVASTLEAYLEKTKPLRGNIANLLLTTRNPFKPANPQTISRWIRAFLVSSGINSKFKAYSTRHASTSAALKKGVDLSIIKSTAGWSKESLTFAKFYNRPVAETENNFAEAVLLS